MQRSRESAQQSFSTARESSRLTPCTQNEGKPGNASSLHGEPKRTENTIAGSQQGTMVYSSLPIEANPLYEVEDTSPTENRKTE